MGGKPLKTIGLMSGTSLDGIDVAVLDTDGEKIRGFGATFFRPYTAQERDVIENATQAALKWKFTGAPPNIFAHAEQIVDAAHIEAVAALLRLSAIDPHDVDLIGYHGQTILHRPPHNGKSGKTVQLGKGEALAGNLGIDTVYDFRSNDMTKGGQGAPLAPIFHKALVDGSGLKLPVAVLNIGGVSNFTIVTNNDEIFATDSGPGNGPIDTWMQTNDIGEYDPGGRYALDGTPDVELISKWLQRDFFTQKVPKSADRWDFDVLSDLLGYSPEDGAATLAVFVAESVRHTLSQYDQTIETLIVCGGGRKNYAILSALREQGIARVRTAEQVGWMGDDIEAQAFAYLAARSVNGLPLSYPSTTGARKPVTGGRLMKAQA
jgi:anhydro-N-acetylmuramic acid kinase